jgi:hypothetical protein
VLEKRQSANKQISQQLDRARSSGDQATPCVDAAITIAGIELAHRIRKGQFLFGRGRRRHGWSRKAERAMALA